MDWIALKGDYNLDLSEDNLNADSDTEDEEFSGSIGIRHFISDKIRVSSEFKAEFSRGATLLDAGGKTNKTEDQSYTWKNTASFRPYKDMAIDGSYDYDVEKNRVNGENTYTENWKASASKKVMIFDFRGDFARQINESRNTDDDNKITKDTWTVDGKVRFSKMLDFTAKYQKEDTTEIHFQDTTKDSTSGSIIRSATWTGEITPFWKASASYDKTDTIDKEVTTTVETKYSYKSTFIFKTINLLLDPTYDITEKEDRQSTPPETTKTKDFKFKISWNVDITDSMWATVDHTHGRKTDSSVGTIERTDNSTANLIWSDPLPGWNVGFDVTRAATDTSEDDQPPDITSAFGFKVDYTYERFSWNMRYTYDKKNLTDDSETFDFKIGWAAPAWDISLTYTFDKTFSAALDEGYTLGLAFKCTL
jgi:hypothetical protein